jgi:hypothetical protein
LSRPREPVATAPSAEGSRNAYRLDPQRCSGHEQAKYTNASNTRPRGSRIDGNFSASTGALHSRRRALFNERARIET